MIREGLLSRLRRQGVLVSDGAWGTFLQKKGLRPGECPELWCLERPQDVLAVARSYVGVGADVIETNSFGGTSFKLEHYGLGGRVAEINRAAAALSRQAAGDDALVIASVGPTGILLLMGEVTGEQLYDAFKVQVEALAAGGADAICIETMQDIEEARIAVRAARENTSLPVLCTFSFDLTVKGEYRTMMGVGPAEAAEAVHAAGASVVGTNCGNGMERMIPIVREIRAALPDVPILVHANAGLPRLVDGVDVFSDSPADMARLAPEVVAAGASIVGGCCGTTPEHIAAIRRALVR